MANTTTSIYMSLPVPVVGVDPGPQWASDVNNCLTLIDSHNHSPGYGQQIGSNGLNITTDLALNSTNLLSIRATRFTPQSSALTLPADLSQLYVVNNDLFFNDGTGAPIRITQNGSIVGTSGSISGLVSPASVNYASGTFTFQSNINTPANLDAASIVLRNFIANSKGLTLSPPNSMASNFTITLPTLPATPAVLTIDSSGNITASATLLASSQSTPNALNNVGLLATVVSNALTIALKQSDGTTDPSPNSPDLISFRSATSSNGSYISRLVTYATSIVIPTGATLGLVSGQKQYIYVYALDNAGVVELAVSGSQTFSESSLQNTTAISGSSTSPSVLYSTTARTGVAIRLLGRVGVNQVVAGTYATIPFEVTVSPINNTGGYSSVYVDGGSPSSSTTRSYLSVQENIGTGITYASNTTSGDTFTINTPGVYSINVVDVYTTPAFLGITINSALPNGAVENLSYAQGRRSLIYFSNLAGNNPNYTTFACLRCNAGDVIRVQQSVAGDGQNVGNNGTVYCHIQQISS